VKPVLEVRHLATPLYKLQDDVEIIGVSMRESLGVVKDESGILRRCELSFDI
jgi:hypothetical protein